MFGWLVVMAAGQSAVWIAHERELTRAGPQCTAPTDSSEVTVCGRRTADRYRVPLIEVTAGDPAHQGVPAERERLLARTTACQEHNAFQIGCGMAGVSVSTARGVTLGAERPLAP